MPAVATPAVLMDRIYGRQRHVYDLTRKYYLLGRDDLIAALRPADGATVLEIGCGTARNLIVAARRYPNARFFGIDVSTSMLETAARAVTRAGLAGRIRLAYADAAAADLTLLFGQDRFDRVFLSYSLSMIPPWRGVVASALALTAADGELHVVDFGDQRGLPRWFDALLRLWLTRFHVEPRDTLETELRVLANRTGATVQMERPYRGYAQYAVARMRS
jgi:S-adenosylmethionine-diacylgycerolhomoserine-N-methlytransferase